LIDQNKRNTLKTVSVVTAATAIAPTATVSAMSNTPTPSQLAHGNSEAVGLVFEIDPATDVSPTWLRVSNPTQQPVAVHQISPGIVTSGDDVFDLNAPLANGPYEIGPDESYSFMMDPLENLESAINVSADAEVTSMVLVPTHFNAAPGEGSVMAARRLVS